MYFLPFSTCILYFIYGLWPENKVLLLLLYTDWIALKEQFVQGVREQSVRQELRRIAYHSVDKSFRHMRDEALHLLLEHDERHHTMGVRGEEVGEAGVPGWAGAGPSYVRPRHD